MIVTQKLLGSAALQTSTADEEILSNNYFNFQMINDQDCHVSINGSEYIFIRANQGITVDTIHSLKIEEDDITFNWIGVRA